ncbi:hypothetical protein [Conexibacter sp. SYSU D00693]|uniref:hypothetical protein n=1 Tax=Conexibacter sp. SYSU D00693 TaxID=2812560 RepID=UPI00196A3376|nr:hypothetical protein [Conexibacter sp. SYSU D00693]
MNRTTIALLTAAAVAAGGAGSALAGETPVEDFTAKRHDVVLQFADGRTTKDDCATGKRVDDAGEVADRGLCRVYRDAGWVGLVHAAHQRGAAKVTWTREWNAAGTVRWTFGAAAPGAASTPATVSSSGAPSGCAYRNLRMRLVLEGPKAGTTTKPVTYSTCGTARR